MVSQGFFVCVCELLKTAQKENSLGTSLVVQGLTLRGVEWLKPHALNAWGIGLIPGLGIKIPHTLGHGQKVNKS